MIRGIAGTIALASMLGGNVSSFQSNRLSFSRIHQTKFDGFGGPYLTLSMSTDTETSKNEARKEMQKEASDALASVGWAPPSLMETGGEGELSSDDPFVQRINMEIQRDMGVPLDGLLNPAKVVNLERDLYNLRRELAALTNVEWTDDQEMGQNTERCDGGGGGEAADILRKKIDKKEKDLFTERRSVFRGWLKNVFLGQAILSLGLSWVMVTDPGSLFGNFGWYEGLQLEMPIKVLGFWWWWLFIVPSLRSRRPGGAEKKALDIAFVGTPLISILAPIATKDTSMIWFANFFVTAGAYGYAFAFDSDDEDEGTRDKNTPAWLKFVYKSLDFGTGQERGARK